MAYAILDYLVQNDTEATKKLQAHLDTKKASIKDAILAYEKERGDALTPADMNSYFANPTAEVVDFILFPLKNRLASVYAGDLKANPMFTFEESQNIDDLLTAVTNDPQIS